MVEETLCLRVFIELNLALALISDEILKSFTALNLSLLICKWSQRHLAHSVFVELKYTEIF